LAIKDSLEHILTIENVKSPSFLLNPDDTTIQEKYNEESLKLGINKGELTNNSIKGESVNSGIKPIAKDTTRIRTQIEQDYKAKKGAIQEEVEGIEEKWPSFRGNPIDSSQVKQLGEELEGTVEEYLESDGDEEVLKDKLQGLTPTEENITKEAIERKLDKITDVSGEDIIENGKGELPLPAPGIQLEGQVEQWKEGQANTEMLKEKIGDGINKEANASQIEENLGLPAIDKNIGSWEDVEGFGEKKVLDKIESAQDKFGSAIKDKVPGETAYPESLSGFQDAAVQEGGEGLSNELGINQEVEEVKPYPQIVSKGQYEKFLGEGSEAGRFKGRVKRKVKDSLDQVIIKEKGGLVPDGGIVGILMGYYEQGEAKVLSMNPTVGYKLNKYVSGVAGVDLKLVANKEEKLKSLLNLNVNSRGNIYKGLYVMGEAHAYLPEVSYYSVGDQIKPDKVNFDYYAGAGLTLKFIGETKLDINFLKRINNGSYWQDFTLEPGMLFRIGLNYLKSNKQ